MITFRTMIPADIPAGLSLCRHAGWNQLARDWELFLKLNPNGCRVGLDIEGNVIGTVTTLPYQNHFTWIGMVLVDPDRRREGIGTQLLMEALALAKHDDTVKLDATPAGREVYLKLDFVDEYAITRMRLARSVYNNITKFPGRPIEISDFPKILKLDRDVFGADRQLILESLFEAAPQLAFLLEEEGNLKGYCFGRPGYNFYHLGPVIAFDSRDAFRLLSTVMQHNSGKEMIIDVIQHHTEFIRFASSLGFVEQRPLIRMYRGANVYPGDPKMQFAILGPEFG
ncbi:GNAT family N-acetyltransferase [Chryseolinea sp. H1M3-3]|uniref:GNAT family N-acetyltransferase n=1 Tax=Chryseolinea sp. H1M3-3 TaxID=3034144 RepID=UPI0023EB1631|nr:GNAT family N-acetyltransferase [Chryseolinea sp. H1M3-3]